MNLKEFETMKEKTIENLENLEIRIDVCVENGMEDSDSELYNHTLDLLDDADEVDSFPELAEIIEHAKVVETTIDTWLASQGETSVALTWPNVPEEYL